MEPMDDPGLKKLLREWQVEDAPRSLDQRVLGVRQPWWMRLMGGSVRVPMPVALAFAVLFVAMGAALLRPRTNPQAPPTNNLAEFRAVQDVQVRIMRGNHEAQ